MLVRCQGEKQYDTVAGVFPSLGIPLKTVYTVELRYSGQSQFRGSLSQATSFSLDRKFEIIVDHV